MTETQVENFDTNMPDAADVLKGAGSTAAAPADDAQRAKRMLNVVQGTLTRFKDEATETAGTEASLRRSLLEQRLFDKLQQEKAALAEAVARETSEREHRLDAEFDAQLTADLAQIHALRQHAATAFQQTTTQPPLFWAPRQ